MVGKKVKHKVFGVGVIIAFETNHVKVEFSTKTCDFVYPDAFEKFLEAEDESTQEQIVNMIEIKKAAEEEKRLEKEESRKAQQEKKSNVTQTSDYRKKVKNIDEMFSEDYNAAYLARNPILTYQQVEDQFGIRISGFGRGINPTSSSVVLISSIGKSNGKFVYHDKWTTNGDYIYSGEGKTGDQSLTKGNLAIKNAAQDNKKIHLFVKFSPREYYYQGVFELVDYTYEDEKDEDGNDRKEYKFKLKKVQG